jgi:hypothetical protein
MTTISWLLILFKRQYSYVEIDTQNGLKLLEVRGIILFQRLSPVVFWLVLILILIIGRVGALYPAVQVGRKLFKGE